MTAGIPFAKGHGTGNDFVVVPDLSGQLTLSAAQVRRLCDRRHGVGGDGVLVVRRTRDCPEVSDQAGAEYFMDYRNADGTVAQMCGNGARVFVRYLVEHGMAQPGEALTIATRGGARAARVEDDGRIRVRMGPASVLPDADLTVSVPGGDRLVARPAVGVLMPNPHAVCWVDDLADAGRLIEPPAVAPPAVFPEGVNVEFVVVAAADHLRMRVHERGVGETQSCGTGACAAAVATWVRGGGGPEDQRMRVDVPGGTVEVRWRADGDVELTGPAVIVASGHIEHRWWSA